MEILNSKVGIVPTKFKSIYNEQIVPTAARRQESGLVVAATALRLLAIATTAAEAFVDGQVEDLRRFERCHCQDGPSSR